MAENRGHGINDSVRDKMTTSKHPRKQRKAIHNMPIHKKRKALSAHLSSDLRKRYNYKIRNVPLVKGDIVKIVRGDASRKVGNRTIDIKGAEAQVAKIYPDSMTVGLEGINVAKSDASEVSRKIHPSNLVIVKLNLTDAYRKKKLEEIVGGVVE